MGLSVDNALPAGTGPIPFALKNLPAGWEWCDGTALTAASPSQGLRNALIADGYPYGKDGSNNPYKPDMRGRNPVGKDDMGGTAANRLTAGGSGVVGSTLGAVGGAETVTLSTTQMPPHNHPSSSGSVTTWRADFDGNSNGVVSGGGSTNGAVAGNPGVSVSVASQGGGGAHSNMPPCLVTNYIIKG